MQMNEHKPTGSGIVDLDDTTLIERVKPNSFGAAGDRWPLHLSSSKITACPRYILTSNTKFSYSGGGARTSGDRDTTSHTKATEKLEIEALLDRPKCILTEQEMMTLLVRKSVLWARGGDE